MVRATLSAARWSLAVAALALLAANVQAVRVNTLLSYGKACDEIASTAKSLTLPTGVTIPKTGISKDNFDVLVKLCSEAVETSAPTTAKHFVIKEGSGSDYECYATTAGTCTGTTDQAGTFIFQTIDVQDTCPITHCNTPSTNCAKRLLKGTRLRVWTCSKCNVGFRLTNGGRACVCPPGTYETLVGTTSACTACPRGSYCPGGSKTFVETAQTANTAAINREKRGPIQICDTKHRNTCAAVTQGNGLGTAASNECETKSLTNHLERYPADRIVRDATAGLTSPDKSRKITQCVTRPGYKIVNLGVADGAAASQQSAVCPADSYNPGSNRNTECTLCDSGAIVVGLKTEIAGQKGIGRHGSDTANALTGTSTNRAVANTRTKKAHCLVPPGKYWNSRSAKPVKTCPAGTYQPYYRAAFADSTCEPCPEGVLTSCDLSCDAGSDAACTACTTSITTFPDFLANAFSGATKLSQCRVVKGGYSGAFVEIADALSPADSVYKAQGAASGKFDASKSFVSATSLCDIGKFSFQRVVDAASGCTACDSKTTTLNIGTECTVGVVATCKSAVCLDNAEIPDVASTCPADNFNFGFTLVDKDNLPSQTFKLSGAGTIKSIEVWLYGLPNGAPTQGDCVIPNDAVVTDGRYADTEVACRTSYTLKLYKGTATTAAATATAYVKRTLAKCSEDALAENNDPDCDGEFVKFVLGADVNVEEADINTFYKWELECLDRCGYYGYCDFDNTLIVGEAYEKTTQMFRDNAFIVNIIPYDPQLKQKD